MLGRYCQHPPGFRWWTATAGVTFSWQALERATAAWAAARHAGGQWGGFGQYTTTYNPARYVISGADLHGERSESCMVRRIRRLPGR